ncbi:MAG TPA: prolyl oligopeptidase family serine peptidase [Acidobacteriaceae bacterium]|nr:prolyl oligopeptidase family serine peptidase [Acidobacteriaceae bacterium]
MEYPQTRTDDQIDDYHGVKVADPYRWLEDDTSDETQAWVKAQNEITFNYLEKIPYRSSVKQRLLQLYNYPKYGIPSRSQEHYIWSKNDGLQNQSVLYVQEGLEGAPRVLIDPNRLSPDGTIRLMAGEASRNGRYFAYYLSSGGSDWMEGRVLEVATGKPLDDRLQWLKVTGLAWFGDGFFYSRYQAPEDGHDLSSRNDGHQVYYHRLGTAQSDDELIYEDPAHPQRFHILQTTEDERFAILMISERGQGKDGNALFFRDLSLPEAGFTPIVAEITNDRFQVIDSVGDKFLILTNRGAPRWRISLYHPKTGWQDVVPETTDTLSGASTQGGKLFVTYARDVTSHPYVHSLDGKLERAILLPGPGTTGGFGGRHDDQFAFYAYSSFNYPSTIFRYDIASGESWVFRESAIQGFRAEDYETRQVFYSSKDGSRVPMFLVHKRGLKLDGNNPTLLYGYGGFNVSVAPEFNPLRLALLEQGFVYASANLRGGGEYGEAWHQAGMKLQKQTVFDDFIAAAEWLISSHYTSPARLAITGGSNGGLLVGAVMNQRPELFRAAVPQVGVMDMLRFQKFTIGWNWIADYGSSDNPDEFQVLYGYSPIHNIREGVTYPSTLITTADHDDRVVPAHSFKYAATLQKKAGAVHPVLIRIDTQSGHGASSTSKALDTAADIYAFLMYSLGIEPR